jgi:hypothetical protein
MRIQARVWLPADIPQPPYRRMVGPQTLNPGAWPNAWPYPDEYDSTAAASAVHHLRYVDAKVRFVEVAYFPGVHGQMHGHPYPSVFAFDAAFGKCVGPPGKCATGFEDHFLYPDSLMNGNDRAVGDIPAGLEAPNCAALGPQAPHAAHNKSPNPLHFYRIEFKRIDGDGLKTHWRQWYPWMTRLTDEYAKTPYVLNY